ncbi:hypothetical protein GCM10009789_56790 [Kribbella sancticallisti]|uniref:Uncharacterized protein n=1 Tax=Kribbella sancticallisti TaxID=460087 RepID=A0ABN2E6D7_9ACTN
MPSSARIASPSAMKGWAIRGKRSGALTPGCVIVILCLPFEAVAARPATGAGPAISIMTESQAGLSGARSTVPGDPAPRPDRVVALMFFGAVGTRLGCTTLAAAERLGLPTADEMRTPMA